MGHDRQFDHRAAQALDPQEGMRSMLRPAMGGVRLEPTSSRRPIRADLTMSVLQYGAAIVAIIAVALLGGLR